MIRKFVPTTMLVLCLLFAAQVAKADNYVFSINNFGQGNNLGTVTTTLSGGSILVTVNVNPLYVIHNAGLGFNVAAGFTGISITNISNPVFTPDLNAQNYDGLGNYAYTLDTSQNTAQARANPITTFSFQVNTTTAGGFTNAGQILKFAAQMAPMDPNGNTGFAATTPAVDINPLGEVPEPSSMILLGSGLIGVGGYFRRRFRK